MTGATTRTVAAPTTELDFTGLTAGTAYTFTVTATNATGTSPASAPSEPVTPVFTVPGAPAGLTVTPGDGQLDVSWSAPDDDGGSAVTGYTVTATPATGAPTTVEVADSGAGLPTSAAVTGLANGTAYDVTVVATNAEGSGPAADPIAATPRTVPGAPTTVTATAGQEQATVSWTAPADDGGSPVTSYTVTADPSGATVTVTAPTTTATVTGLAGGVATTFTVTASNAAGTGAASDPSSPVTPSAPPAADPEPAPAPAPRRPAPAPAPAPATEPLLEPAPVTDGGTASGEVTAGETLTTDVDGTGATAEAPVQTAVTAPTDGTVTISTGPVSGSAPSGWSWFDQQVSISAPPGTADAPLVLSFRFDSSLDAGGAVVFRDGVPVAECPGSAVARPDPCVTGRRTAGDDTVITVLSSHASEWNVGRPTTACPTERVPAAGFADVEGGVHGPSIDCMVWWDVAHGVTTTRFDPTGNVTRGQMAAFVARSIRAAGAELPKGTDRFTDDDGTIFEDDIDALAAAGVVAGIGANRYAPDRVVTRGEMATFLVRAHEVVTGQALVGTSDPFTDDDGAVHEDSIDAAYDAGLVRGTAPGTYTPTRAVRRAEMATFLSRLLDGWVVVDAARTPV